MPEPRLAAKTVAIREVPNNVRARDMTIGRIKNLPAVVTSETFARDCLEG